MCSKNGPCTSKAEDVIEMLCVVASLTQQLKPSGVLKMEGELTKCDINHLLITSVDRSVAIIKQVLSSNPGPLTWDQLRVYIAEMLRASLDDLGNPLPVEEKVM